MKPIRKVIFIDVQPRPDGTAPSQTTYEVERNRVNFRIEDGMLIMADEAGHELEVPLGRVARIFRA